MITDDDFFLFMAGVVILGPLLIAGLAYVIVSIVTDFVHGLRRRGE